MDQDAVDRFVESWGSMGVLWGINRSMARIHALLIASDEPMALDTIAKRLQISRGNTSMSLKELRSWGVIQRVHLPGDRRDHYITDDDVWTMLFRILSERKKREFDPALSAVRETLEALPEGADSGPRRRLTQMEDLLSTMDRVMAQALADEARSRAMLQFVTAPLPRDEG